MNELFKALLINEQEGKFTKEIKALSPDQLPQHELLIRVHYSSVNYKDALSATGNKGVTRTYPHVPGIDAAGVVVRSQSELFKAGEEVLVTGWDLGMNTWGGFGEYISVPAAWALKLPGGLSMQEAMSFGTAGLTAGLSIHRLLNAGIKPENGEIAVSGATGGVGSIAVAILAKNGFNVAAVSGKKEEAFLLDTLGAKRIIPRDEFSATYDKKPLSAPTFAAGIDTVGGPILSGMLKATHYGGIVTACGMVAANDLHTSVFPFILRGVTLAGIDSVQAPMEIRQEVWTLLATSWKPAQLNNMIEEISLSDLPEKLEAILAGKARGRYVLAHAHR
ncbi:YhdH/YhfP family quinone oxidoreductase [Chitinophaga pinensis]|uniref:Acryloyl-CoA reductase n=1 Tax=Chitinophaga pinensis TaxID=79329 RepID=A0A5C6LNB4_9BACT|nr:YhdH/YhfP family quinone oxidoreductase [Chitinophaga pinensis]TWV95677.1 acryloyl-CoA reductase [Chitinophaga pinensis]